jgi:hypothetical protein
LYATQNGARRFATTRHVAPDHARLQPRFGGGRVTLFGFQHLIRAWRGRYLDTRSGADLANRLDKMGSHEFARFVRERDRGEMAVTNGQDDQP